MFAPLASSGHSADWDPVAVIALLLSVVAIGIQLVTRYLDGGRIRVSLQPVIYDPVEDIVHTVSDGRWPYRLASAKALTQTARRTTGIDLAEIVVVNVGRLPVTITTMELATPSETRRRGRRQWHHFGLPPLELPDFEPHRFVDSAKSLRLEPYSQVSILVDPWQVLRPGRKTPKGVTVLRASARVPGKDKPTLSRRQRSWRIGDDVVSSIEAATTLPLLAVIVKAIFTSSHSHEGRPDVTRFPIDAIADRIAAEPWPADWRERRKLVSAAMAEHPYDFEDTPENQRKSRIYAIAIARALDLAGDTVEWPPRANTPPTA